MRSFKWSKQISNPVRKNNKKIHSRRNFKMSFYIRFSVWPKISQLQTGRMVWCMFSGLYINKREKGRDLTQWYDKIPYIQRQIQNATWQHKNATKTLITQPLRTDLWRSVGLTIATQLVWLNRLGIPTFPLTATAVWSKGHTFKNV